VKFFSFGKDGGPESRVWGFWLIEIKSLFSIALLRFEDGSRDAYHNHAFNALSWVLSGELVEMPLGSSTETYRPSFWPIWTPRQRFHKVVSKGRTWALTVRGPWSRTWKEYLPKTNDHITLTHGRVKV